MNFKADLVIAKGQVIAEDGEWQVKLPVVKYPKWVTNSIHLKRKLSAADFVLRTRAAHGAEVGACHRGDRESGADPSSADEVKS